MAVCEHGRRRRGCPVCERDEEIAELRAENERLRSLDPTGWARLYKQKQDDNERLRDLYRSERQAHYSCDVGAYQHVSIQEWNAATELILKPAAKEGGE